MIPYISRSRVSNSRSKLPMGKYSLTMAKNGLLHTPSRFTTFSCSRTFLWSREKKNKHLGVKKRECLFLSVFDF